MNRHQVEESIRLLSARRAETEEQLRRSEQRLAEVESEQKELEGAVNLARRAIADLNAHAEKLKEELKVAAIEEARAAVAQATQARQTAEEEAANAARQLRAAYDRLQQVRQAVDEAQAALDNLGIRPDAPLEPEQSVFQDEWQSLAPLVENELNTRLEAQMVAAAADSGNPFDIEALPAHLQVLARARRRELLRESRGRTAF
jgi:chromosome segregation ATPase